MKCRVTKLAFHNGERVKPGRLVEISTKKIPSWCVPVGAVADEVAEAPAVVAPKARRGSKAAPAVDAPAAQNEIEGAGQDLV